MDFLPHSPDRRRGWTTPHMFLLKLETKSAACDGPNGTHSLPGPVLAFQGMSKTNNPGSRPRGSTDQVERFPGTHRVQRRKAVRSLQSASVILPFPAQASHFAG